MELQGRDGQQEALGMIRVILFRGMHHQNGWLNFSELLGKCSHQSCLFAGSKRRQSSIRVAEKVESASDDLCPGICFLPSHLPGSFRMPPVDSSLSIGQDDLMIAVAILCIGGYFQIGGVEKIRTVSWVCRDLHDWTACIDRKSLPRSVLSIAITRRRGCLDTLLSPVPFEEFGQEKRFIVPNSLF